MKKLFVIVATILLSAMISCSSGGSGGDNKSSVSSAAGLYKGTTNTGRNINGLILNDGTYFFIYSGSVYSAETEGVLQGESSIVADNFSSNDAMDLNITGSGVKKGKLVISYTPKVSAYGMMRFYENDVYTFTITYDSDYEKTPLLSVIEGTFTGWVASSQGKENATLTVSSTGEIAMNSGTGCAVTGSAVPHSKANLYNVSLSFGGAPCYFENQNMTGIAYYSSEYKRIWVIAPNSDHTDGMLFEGNKE